MAKLFSRQLFTECPWVQGQVLFPGHWGTSDRLDLPSRGVQSNGWLVSSEKLLAVSSLSSFFAEALTLRCLMFYIHCIAFSSFVLTSTMPSSLEDGPCPIPSPHITHFSTCIIILWKTLIDQELSISTAFKTHLLPPWRSTYQQFPLLKLRLTWVVSVSLALVPCSPSHLGVVLWL